MIASILFLLPWQELDRPYLAQSSRDLLPIRASGLWESPLACRSFRAAVYFHQFTTSPVRP